ncbi:hypothetical protein SAMN02746089_02243 [Caldanaerobius fijiensis DSM 17918]|uniref:DUF5320 domain-containing protein n=1 Tax=Caldanaerobius fijiensis DSM 17918 TaxID=1121256 RepID=A0A1M5D2G8_9THEO|nr:DUF5320 domain-containing protein [Caldanaerobius fijiensis]SHF61037.1 hypothetical protein SAMN02746089_02243 [Caldanaerobius fijiensis DSM 17918]
MPRGDGTGPLGLGPMTGRAAGFCAGFTVPGFMNPGIGYYRGFGRGRGFRWRYYYTGVPGWARYGYPVYGQVYAPQINEKEFLTEQAKFLENQLQEIKERLKALGKDDE